MSQESHKNYFDYDPDIPDQYKWVLPPPETSEERARRRREMEELRQFQIEKWSWMLNRSRPLWVPRQRYIYRRWIKCKDCGHEFPNNEGAMSNQYCNECVLTFWDDEYIFNE